jgi:Peptidase M60, enhancin and enhancin-like/N-terminal domain of M60-like peptidases
MAEAFRRILLSATALVTLCALSARAAAADADLDTLLAGVKDIAAPGTPGSLCVFGKNAFPVLVGGAGRKAQQAVVAAARLGKGRAVVFAHNGYFGAEALAVGDTGRLMVNATRWLGGRRAPEVAAQGMPDLVAHLVKSGISAVSIGSDWPAKLGKYDVFISARSSRFDDRRVAALSRFIEGGGGFLSGDCPWGWLQLNPGKSLLTDHGGNRLLARAGLVWADGYAGRTSKVGFAAAARPSRLVHAKAALGAIEAEAAGRERLKKKDRALASWIVIHAARAVPPDDEILLPRLRELMTEHAARAVPSPKEPLKQEQALARLALTLQMADIERAAPEDTTAHPSAKFFPGTVPPEAERVTETLVIDTSIPAWHGTGLYAAPGEIVTVTVPAGAAGKGLGVRIGCHTDGLWHLDSWKRAPTISRRFSIDAAVTKTANAFGGLVYVDVPKTCRLGRVEVTVVGAVRSPRFILGKTDPATWKNLVRDYPGPWAEIETGKVVLTVPSKSIRDLDDPVALAEFWVHVMDSCAELLTRPLDRQRPERYVSDVQISAGYMHSGYPIMTWLDAADFGTDLPRLMAKGSWGHFHEMGHNHQSGLWTFAGTGEVTCNLFSIYVSERCCGLVNPAHGNISAASRAKNREAHLAGGAPYSEWKRRPFLALDMYIQLKEAFGWDAYKRVFAVYRDLSQKQHPRSDLDKRDMWMETFSRAVGRNLGPFFEAWGVPTSKEARARIAKLPPWMPEGFPE